MTNELQKLQDKLALLMFNQTRESAWAANVCIDCCSPIRDERGTESTGEPGQIYSDAGAREYGITAMCETCYDNIFA